MTPQHKWITLIFEDGSKHVESLDSSGNLSRDVPAGKRVSRVIIGDAPADPLSAAFAQRLDTTQDQVE